MLPHTVAPDRSCPDSAAALKEVLGRLHAAGVVYCALRYHDPESPAGDLDILIDGESVDGCRRVLEEQGFVAAPSRSPFKMVMLRYSQGLAICLDIHWKAVQYGMVYMDAGRMLARRVESDGLFHLSLEDELIHLVIHNFLRKGALRTHALDRIRQLLSQRIDRRYLHEHLDAFGLRPAFHAAVAWVEQSHANAAYAGLRRRAFWAVMRAQPGNAHRYLVLRFGSRSVRKRRGGLVAFVGPDGSGKSTVIRTLTERAHAIPGLKVRTTYLGPWGQMKLSLVPALRKLGITPAVQPVGLHLASGADRKDGSKRSWIGSLVKGCVFYTALYIELVYRYATSVFFRVRRGEWIVADRYITDLRYLYKERPIGNYGAIRRLLCAMYPKPDLFIVLDNRPDVIVSRKGGLAAAQIETLRHYMLMAARNYRFEVVTTDRPPEEIADHVLNRMLSMRALK
jgi:thymidylate kinase